MEVWDTQSSHGYILHHGTVTEGKITTTQTAFLHIDDVRCNSIAPDLALFFSQKVLVFFLVLHENICCGYSLEVPR